MTARGRRRYAYLAVGLVALALLVLQFGGVLPRVGGAYPMLLLPLVLVCGERFGAVTGAVAGALIGTAADIFSAASPVFHLAVFCLFGCAAGLLFTFYLNRNRLAETVVIAVAGLLYYLLRWLFFYRSAGSFFTYYVDIGIPSAVYTALLGVPLCFLISVILRATENTERR